MKINLLAFGIAKEILGKQFLEMELPTGTTVSGLRSTMVASHPRLSALASVRLAVNSEYAAESLVLNENDEVAIIPPVSGG